ncbi:MAG TPA: PmoA family protein [Candidatus Hydrogenedentes bacterium]|nr:PmoA family protein [Candidatus Hydrogenedentota bacterium]HPG68303.1 PmoA family protein [Candidatus Hydrogenedentota bacterium]
MPFLFALWAAMPCVVDATEPPVFPRVCAVPLPHQEVAFEVENVEVARYHYGGDTSKPYLYPFIGPAGRSLLRLGHPHDPDGHRHHLGVWVAHKSVNGHSFWEEDTGSRIAHERIEAMEDGGDAASLIAHNTWLSADGKSLLNERRTTTLHNLGSVETCLDITIELSPAEGDVILDKTPFGFLGVRVAKTMSTNDGGGAIRNSQGDINEEQVLWKRARWVDYTGPVAPGTDNGIALFDHPDNPRFPTYFHVRGDGWMGASFCYEDPYTIKTGDTLVLRYRLLAHGQGPQAAADRIEGYWQRWAKEKP